MLKIADEMLKKRMKSKATGFREEMRKKNESNLKASIYKLEIFFLCLNKLEIFSLNKTLYGFILIIQSLHMN